MAAKLDVGLLVTSRRFSLAELAERFGREPQSGSHDKDDLRLKEQPWGISIWRENALDATAPLEVQCLQLLQDMPSACVELREADPDDIAVCLVIAAFFHAAYLDLALPPKLIGEIAAKGVELKITGYPCTPDDLPISA